MDCSRSVARMRPVLRALICGAILCPALIIGGRTDGAAATPSAGCRTISFGAGNDVGASADDVSSVAVGDLDNDGDLDIVSGSWYDEDYEVIAWENDGTPFTALWAQNDVGASTDHVTSVALGDLDHDGDLDIVSGSWSGEDYEVIAWENDGTPFTNLWSQNDVGAAADRVMSVALGDLDDDGAWTSSPGVRLARTTRSLPGRTMALPSPASGPRTTWGPAGGKSSGRWP